MIHTVLAHLTCPTCHQGLTAGPGRVHCPAGHSYDLARAGYLTLTAGRAKALPGDSADMVRAREAFLGAGHYTALADRLADRLAAELTGGLTGGLAGRLTGELTGRLAGALTDQPANRLAGALAAGGHGRQAVSGTSQDSGPAQGGSESGGSGTSGGAPVVVDVGAGTGYYLARLLRSAPGAAGIAVDASRYALRRAARAHPRIGAIGTDVRGPLPIRTATAALVLDVFAPRNAAEMHRVLRPDGRLAIVTPTVRHLGEIVGPLGLVTVDERKSERLRAKLAGFFVQQDRLAMDLELSLSPDDLLNLVMMGPTAHHRRAPEVRAAIEASWPRGARPTASFTVEIHAPCPGQTVHHVGPPPFRGGRQEKR
ncbi:MULTISPECIES: methyltransferase domain-containing protein [unclassified Frankia]|uniref:methyltransferase domain-containing protein n=1 Tax=unclassified Frankia TaxID=2632575 RepID=UPI0020243E67